MAVMASVRRSQEPAAPGNMPGVNVVAVGIFVAFLAGGLLVSAATGSPIPAIVAGVIGALLMPAPRSAQQWERAVVLRFGRYVGLRGPGLFWVMPFIDQVSSTI